MGGAEEEEAIDLTMPEVRMSKNKKEILPISSPKFLQFKNECLQSKTTGVGECCEFKKNGMQHLTKNRARINMMIIITHAISSLYLSLLANIDTSDTVGT